MLAAAQESLLLFLGRGILEAQVAHNHQSGSKVLLSGHSVPDLGLRAEEVGMTETMDQKDLQSLVTCL